MVERSELGFCSWKKEMQRLALVGLGNSMAFSVPTKPCLRTISAARASMVGWTKNLEAVSHIRWSKGRSVFNLG